MIYIIYCLEMGKGRRGRPKKNVTLENEPKGRKSSNTFVDKNDLFFSSDEDERKENQTKKKITKRRDKRSIESNQKIKEVIIKLKTLKLIFRNQSIESLLWDEFKKQKQNNLHSVIAFFCQKESVIERKVDPSNFKIFQDFTLDELESPKTILRDRFIQTLNREKFIDTKINKKLTTQALKIFQLLEDGSSKQKQDISVIQKSCNNFSELSAAQFQDISFVHAYKIPPQKQNFSRNLQQDEIQQGYYTESQQFRHEVVMRQLGLLSESQSS